MWRVLHAELNNDRFRIALVYAFCMACFVTIWFGVKWERNRAPLTMLIILVSTFIGGFGGEKQRNVQKRDRLHVLLPLSLRRIGWAHLLYPFLIWLSILLLFFVSYFVVQQISGHGLTQPSMLQLLTLNGLILVVNAVYLLYRDLRLSFTTKRQRFIVFLVWLMIYIAALLPFYIVTNFFGWFGEHTPLQIFLNKLSASPVGFNALGLLLSAMSFIIFTRRKSYVSS